MPSNQDHKILTWRERLFPDLQYNALSISAVSPSRLTQPLLSGSSPQLSDNESGSPSSLYSCSAALDVPTASPSLDMSQLRDDLAELRSARQGQKRTGKTERLEEFVEENEKEWNGWLLSSRRTIKRVRHDEVEQQETTYLRRSSLILSQNQDETSSSDHSKATSVNAIAETRERSAEVARKAIDPDLPPGMTWPMDTKWSGFARVELVDMGLDSWIKALAKFTGPGGGAEKKFGPIKKCHMKAQNGNPVHMSHYRPNQREACIVICVKSRDGGESTPCHVFVDGTGTAYPKDRRE